MEGRQNLYFTGLAPAEQRRLFLNFLFHSFGTSKVGRNRLELVTDIDPANDGGVHGGFCLEPGCRRTNMAKERVTRLLWDLEWLFLFCLSKVLRIDPTNAAAMLAACILASPPFFELFLFDKPCASGLLAGATAGVWPSSFHVWHCLNVLNGNQDLNMLQRCAVHSYWNQWVNS